jgi:uncharacterized damage-inducible protein DinB
MLKASRQALLRVADVTPERAVLRPNDGEWSVLEVLAHLVDVDYHWLAQAIAMRDDSAHMFTGFDDTAWKQEHVSICETPLPDVLARLAESHEAVISKLASVSDADLDAPGRHPRGIPYKVRDVFLRYPPHDDDHKRQIQEIVASI